MKTDVTVILDRSGSMSATRDAAIEGFNALVTDQKKVDGECVFSLCHFDDRFNDLDMPSYVAIPIADVPLLTPETFVPRGWTALLDAMGRTINTTGARLAATPAAERPDKVIVVVITDGQENRSQEFTAEKIKEMVEHQRDVYKWEFVFLGSNQDAILVAKQYGVPQANTMSYDADPHGTRAAYAAVSSNMASMRAGSSRTMSFSDDQRAEHVANTGGSSTGDASSSKKARKAPRHVR